MPRDLLLALLVIGVTLNVALIVFVAWANTRAAARTPSADDADPGAPIASDDTDPARLLSLGSRLVDRDWIDTRAEGEPSSAGRAREPAVRAAEPLPAAEPRLMVGGPPPATAHPALEPAPTARRPRRFVLPDRDESQDRSQRAIEAFFGQGVPARATPRPARRRSRVRRPPGAPIPRTDLVLALGDGRYDARVVQAVSDALRGTLRDSDRVVELPGGRLQVTLEADARGGDAFLRRARTVLQPWLGVVDPDLELRVERPQRAERRPGTAS